MEDARRGLAPATPTLILIDRQGYIRKHKFGAEQDLALGAEIMALMREDDASLAAQDAKAPAAGACDETGCHK